MFDPPWWFLFVVIAINLPWFAGVALFGACLPRPGARWWWRLAAFIAGGVVAGAAAWLASWIVWDVLDAGMAAHRTLERTVWAVNGVAAVAAAALVVLRRRR